MLVGRYRSILSKLTAEGRAKVISELEAISWEDVTAGANEAVEIMLRHCGQYTSFAAVASFAAYNRLRLKDVGAVLDSLVECGYDPVMLEDNVRAMVNDVMDGKVDVFNSKCGDRFEYEVKNAGKTAMEFAIRRDPEKPRYAVVPGGTCCMFCAMLASRGAVYSEAEFAEALHPHCGCVAVPTWTGRVDVDGYDPDAYYERYVEESTAK